MAPRLRVAVIIASAGRPDVVGDVLADVRAQTRPPEWLVLSVPGDDSLPSAGVAEDVVIAKARGAAAQRNEGMRAASGADIVVFFDDDSRVRDDYLEKAIAVFETHEGVIALTGRVLLDGAASEQVTVEEAELALAQSTREVRAAGVNQIVDRRTLYGCNFAFRAGNTSQRFDERLPLYSWLEDHDLARRLLREGRIVTAPDCVIVHRGVKTGGRTHHLRLGYSQVMNPAYFWNKGSFPLSLAINEGGRLLAKNLLRSFALGPEKVWRRERLRGNFLAALDVLRGRFTPERILDL